jgi:mono/diheme cytochrome c family protein
MNKLAIATLVSFAALTLTWAAEPAENWTTHCASCHGKDGKGLTKAGRMAGVKDLTDAAHQKSFTDEKAVTQIKQGMKDDKGKEKMKPFADKMNDEEIKALVGYLRAFKK